MSTFFTGRQICAVNGSRGSLPSEPLKWQLPEKKDKGRVIAHRGTQKVKGHTRYKQAWLFLLTTTVIAGAISPLKNWPKCLLMQSCCNGQKFRVEVPVEEK